MTVVSWRRDTSVLCDSLTYEQGPPEVLEGTAPSTSRPWTLIYSPPFDEFEVLRVRIPGTELAVGLQEAMISAPVRICPASCQLLIPSAAAFSAFRSFCWHPLSVLALQRVSKLTCRINTGATGRCTALLFEEFCGACELF